MQTIGVAGTAKNTGKTTTALHILSQAQTSGLVCALTSIGYDGEDRDNVTGLPKPHYRLEEGMLVATASECLESSPARLKILQASGVHTILGEVILAQVVGAGDVLLAGPNRQSDVTKVLDMFIQHGAELALVDGALNRLVPMIATDGLVLATGAALEDNIATIARHSATMTRLFTFPVAQPCWRAGCTIQVRLQSNKKTELKSASLFSGTHLQQLLSAIQSPVKALLIPNLCKPGLLGQILNQAGEQLRGAELVFGNPLKLLASGYPLSWEEVLHAASQLELRLAYQQTLPLLILTANPFYPLYNPLSYNYEEKHVDAPALLSALREAVACVPVLDIRQTPDIDLLDLLFKRMALTCLP